MGRWDADFPMRLRVLAFRGRELSGGDGEGKARYSGNREPFSTVKRGRKASASPLCRKDSKNRRISKKTESEKKQLG